MSTSLAHQQGINSILQQQTKVNNTQQQISLGKRILNPSDDPAGSVQLLDLNQALSRLEQFQANNDYAVNRLSTSESTLQSVTSNLQRVRELAVQGFNDVNTPTDKKSIAEEMYQRLDEILALANTKDANGDYLYAGFKTQTKPFTGTSASGLYTYQGDQSQRFLEIGEDRSLADGNSGAEVFFNLQDKNGNPEDIFSTLYALANDLSSNKAPAEEMAFTINGGLTDTETLTINGLTYEFDNNGSVGSTVVDGVTVPNIIVDISDIPGVPAIPLTSDEIATNLAAAIGNTDVTVSVTGNELQLLAGAEGEGGLSFTDGTTAGDITVTEQISIPLYDHLDQIDTALGRILDVRSQIGARLNALDSQDETNQDFILSLEQTKSQIADIDIAEAISRFNFQIVSLQAAQQAYVKVQNLSLFNLL